jgi:hypothetical protein
MQEDTVPSSSSSSSSPIPATDPGTIAGLVLLFLLGLVVIFAVGRKSSSNRCLHLPFVSISCVSVFSYAACDAAGVDAHWLIAVLIITISVWFLLAALFHIAHHCRNYQELDVNDNSINGLDDGL